LAAISAYQSFESKGGIPKDLENSMTYMRRYLQVGMVSPCQDALRLVPRAETANHLDLASQLITEGLRERPDNLDLLTLRVRIDFKKSDYLSALKAADAILHQKPGDAKMQSLRKEILGKLEGWLAKERSVKSGK
jgi:predicted Zn-dependent protease